MFLKLYAIALPVFFAIDMLWLGVIARDFYRQQLGALMRTEFNWYAAFLFYFLFIAGLVFFVIDPALQQRSLVRAIVVGAFFGCITYATYDLTNLATLKQWPLLMTIVDIIWGMFLAAAVSAVTYSIAVKIID